MKKLLSGIFIVSAVIAFTSCKKCATCTFSEEGLTKDFVFSDGDSITVELNSTVSYKGNSYSQGEMFAIIYDDIDTSVYNNGLQFTGNGTVTRTLTSPFCDKGKRFTDKWDLQKKNGWKCVDGDRKDPIYDDLK